jgi:hypothetical protein
VVLFPVADEETVTSRWPWSSRGALTLAVAGAAVAVALWGAGRNATGTIAERPLGVAPPPLDSAATLSNSAKPAWVDSGRVTASARSPRDARIDAPAQPPARRIRARPGRLFINATPWGRIYVDGVLLGNTPKVALPVAPGTHRVRIMRDGYAPFERTVGVAPGQDLRLTDIVLVEVQP